MDISSEQFKEELERLKSKYRKEALRAVAAADADGYSRGINEVKEAAEKKIAHWKAVAEAVTSNDKGNSKPVLLVQLIAEQIYRDMKVDFSKDTETLAKIKVQAIGVYCNTNIKFYISHFTVLILLHPGNTSFKYEQAVE